MLKRTSINTFRNLQFNEGLLFYDVDITEFRDSSYNALKLDRLLTLGNRDSNFLGATRGGIVFSAIPKIRSFFEDGAVYASKSATVIEGWDTWLEATLVEFSPYIFSRILPNSVIDDQFTESWMIDIKTKQSGIIHENLVWLGDLSSGGLVAIELRNAVNIGGIRIDTKSDTENGIKIRYAAFSGDYFDRNKPPYSIYFIDKREEN